MYLGCHLSASAGYCAMIKTAQQLNANTFAYFTRNPRGSKAKEENLSDIAKANIALKELFFGNLVAHGAYTMNLCTADSDARAFAAGILEDDIRRVSAISGSYYNFHPGSHVGQGTQIGIQQICEALVGALRHGYPVTILLETMAGKGSEVGGNFQEIRQILDGVGSDHLGVCLDTCHVWDAGYDIVNDLDGVLNEFDKVVGLDRLYALHLNDSLNDCGSHKDRHARIGQGKLGVETFRTVLKHPALRGKPMILETPNTLPGYGEEIKLLRQLAG